MIVEIRAKYICDECGDEFSVRVDPAARADGPCCALDFADDAIRGGIGYDDGTPPESGRFGAVEGGRHFCKVCAEEEDE